MGNLHVNAGTSLIDSKIRRFVCDIGERKKERKKKSRRNCELCVKLNGLIGGICRGMCVVCASLDRFMKPDQVIYIWTGNLIFFLRTFLWNRGYKCKKEARYMGGLFRRTLNKEPLVWRDWPICFQFCRLCCINEYLRSRFLFLRYSVLYIIFLLVEYR